MISAEDIIAVNSWRSVPDHTWHDGELPPSGSVYVIPERLREFFELAATSNNKYVVVSAESDYCLVKQAEHPVNHDMPKWMKLVASNIEAKYPENSYMNVSLDERCDTNNCRLSDKYSMKCDMYTLCTFNYIPPNIVRLYISNTDIDDDERIIKIPFGIMPSKVDQMASLSQELFGKRKKNGKTYANFTLYTVKRSDILKTLIRTIQMSDPVLDPSQVIINHNLDWQDYIIEMSGCSLVLCPAGNGFDCYRSLESHYVGSIGIYTSDRSQQMIKLPKFEVPDMTKITMRDFRNMSEALGDHSYEIVDWAKLSHWKARIKHDRTVNIG